MRRRSTALLGGLAAFALVAASAAGLGGLEVGGLGAESSEVTACTEAGIDAAFTTGEYDADADLFPVATVTLAVTDGDDAGACSDTDVVVVLLDADPGLDGAGNVLATLRGGFDAFSGADGFTVPSTVDAEAVEGMAVSIVG